MISEYHTIHHTCSMEKMLPRRMSMHDCTQFWPGNGSECKYFAHKLEKFLGGDPPNPHPVLGHVLQGCSVSRLPLFWLTQLSDSSRAPGKLLQTDDPLNAKWKDFLYSTTVDFALDSIPIR